MKKTKLASKTLLVLGLLLLMFFVLFPSFWLVISSLKPAMEIFSLVPTLWPHNATLEGYRYAFTPSPGPELLPYLLNSLQVAGYTALVTTVFAATGGYAIGRRRFPGMQVIIVFLMLAQMFQGPVIMVSWYRMAEIGRAHV